MPVHLSFHGGVETITGSCHLLKAGGLNILIDCGLFQGTPQWEKRNYDDFGFEPSSLDYVLITHGHLDHCGRIPLLVKKGFRGKIICTEGTFDIVKIILMDSAKIQEEDYEHWRRLRLRKGQRPEEPLYRTLDVLDSLRYFNPVAHYGRPMRLNNQVTAVFKDSGHIFGASFIEIDIRGHGKVVFSGDLGNRNKPIIKDPSFPDKAGTVVIEGTYGNRNHKNIDDSVEELQKAIVDTFKRGGNVLIPSFAVERAQDLLFYIREFIEQGRIPPCKVFLDSPMAIRVTDIMRRRPEYFDKETENIFRKYGDPFDSPGLEFTRTPDQSMKINFVKSHAIIIAGSGMCTGGRIKHHLKHNIWKKQSSIIFVGYQARGTLGRKIVDRHKKVKIFGEPFRVKSQVHTIGGFSSHADRDILIEWLTYNKGLRRVFLVHGEKDSLQSLRKGLQRQKAAKKIHIPRFHERISF
jgi:metallo-beta-lactamase family protein